MDDSKVVLCPALKQLTDEHQSLRADMDLFYEITEEIEFESGSTVLQLFEKLNEQISAFLYKLKEHSKREEDWLFPMMAHHLGDNDKSIEVMEFEHEKAERHLQDFLTESDQAGLNLDENDAQTITVYAVQAYATLTQHFANEDKVLFPLAENILSVEEKKELERLFHV